MLTCTSVRASEQAEGVRMRRNRVRRSRRPRRLHGFNADSSRIQQAEMTRPAAEAVVTERWS
ncbi:MAG: hypothetical protein ACKPJJ_31355, partial [Planctomycetaceae bacterium]